RLYLCLLCRFCHLRLTFTRLPYTTLFRSAADGPDLVVQWTRIEVLRMSDGTGSESRTPLTAAAMGEAGPALADPDVLELASRVRSEEHTSELQSRFDLVCRLLLEKQNSDT